MSFLSAAELLALQTDAASLLDGLCNITRYAVNSSTNLRDATGIQDTTTNVPCEVAEMDRQRETIYRQYGTVGDVGKIDLRTITVPYNTDVIPGDLITVGSSNYKVFEVTDDPTNKLFKYAQCKRSN